METHCRSKYHREDHNLQEVEDVTQQFEDEQNFIYKCGSIQPRMTVSDVFLARSKQASGKANGFSALVPEMIKLVSPLFLYTVFHLLMRRFDGSSKEMKRNWTKNVSMLIAKVLRPMCAKN